MRTDHRPQTARGQLIEQAVETRIFSVPVRRPHVLEDCDFEALRPRRPCHLREEIRHSHQGNMSLLDAVVRFHCLHDPFEVAIRTCQRCRKRQHHDSSLEFHLISFRLLPSAISSLGTWKWPPKSTRCSGEIDPTMLTNVSSRASAEITTMPPSLPLPPSLKYTSTFPSSKWLLERTPTIRDHPGP